MRLSKRAQALMFECGWARINQFFNAIKKLKKFRRQSLLENSLLCRTKRIVNIYCSNLLKT